MARLPGEFEGIMLTQEARAELTKNFNQFQWKQLQEIEERKGRHLTGFEIHKFFFDAPKFFGGDMDRKSMAAGEGFEQ